MEQPHNSSMPDKPVILNASAIHRVLTRIGHEIAERNDNGHSVVLVGVQRGGITLRYASAEARRLLLERAAERLSVPVERLTVRDGVVSVTGDAQRRIGYGDLIGGQHFHHKLEWKKQYGNPLLAKGQATPKSPSEYKIVGRSIPQRIVADKAHGKLQYVTDVRVEGMLHARVVRSPTAGCAVNTQNTYSISTVGITSARRPLRLRGTSAFAATTPWVPNW